MQSLASQRCQGVPYLNGGVYLIIKGVYLESSLLISDIKTVFRELISEVISAFYGINSFIYRINPLSRRLISTWIDFNSGATTSCNACLTCS